MKTTIGKVGVAAVLVVALAAAGGSADEPKWFDPGKCELCKPMAAKPELAQAVKAETLKLANGIVTVYTVAPEKLADYREAHAQMRAVMQRARAGGKVELCGRCQAIVDLVRQHADREYVPTSTGGLCLTTSTDPKLQEKIWAFKEKDDKMKTETKAPQ